MLAAKALVNLLATSEAYAIFVPWPTMEEFTEET